ncbi:MAG: hypothetical protein AAFN79_20185, partial [Pseudomonadota bacterium]
MRGTSSSSETKSNAPHHARIGLFRRRDAKSPLRAVFDRGERLRGGFKGDFARTPDLSWIAMLRIERVADIVDRLLRARYSAKPGDGR